MGENKSGDEDQKIDETEEKAGSAADEGQEDAEADDAQEDDSSDDDKSDDAGDDDADEGDDDDKSDDEDSADNDKEDSKEDDKSKKKPTPKKADEEPQTRKRNIDFILERKNRKIEKLKGKDKADKADDADEDNDGLAPDDAEAIDKRAMKIIAPIANKLAQDEDEKEISDFLAANPDFKPYEAKARKYAAHESRKHLPIKAVFYEVAGDDLLKIGAQRGKKADDEAKKSRAGGGASRSGGGEKSVLELSDEEFAAEQEKVRRKPRE